MIKRMSPARPLLLAACLVVAAFLGTGCSPSVVVPVTLIDGFTIPNLNGYVAGDAIPDDIEIPELSLCGPLPSRDDLDALLADALGPLFGKLVSIESVALLDTTLTATKGSFEDLTYFGMYFAVNGTQVDLGEGASTEGLASPLVLTPASSVDFLELLDSAASGGGDCPSLGVKIRGTVPSSEDMPAVTMKIQLKITGKIGF